MKKPVPGLIDLQSAIDYTNTIIESKTDAERLVALGIAVQKLTYGLKQALQAIYDEVV